MYKVFEVFPDGKKYFRFESNEMFDCIVYIEHHKYDTKKSRLQLYEEVKDFDETIAEMAEFFEMESNNE